MPSKTPKQARAMHAAASGKSTLGIPKSVGKEFVQADHLRKNASGGKSGGASIGGGTAAGGAGGG